MLYVPLTSKRPDKHFVCNKFDLNWILSVECFCLWWIWQRFAVNHTLFTHSAITHDENLSEIQTAQHHQQTNQSSTSSSQPVETWQLFRCPTFHKQPKILTIQRDILYISRQLTDYGGEAISTWTSACSTHSCYEAANVTNHVNQNKWEPSKNQVLLQTEQQTHHLWHTMKLVINLLSLWKTALMIEYVPVLQHLQWHQNYLHGCKKPEYFSSMLSRSSTLLAETVFDYENTKMLVTSEVGGLYNGIYKHSLNCRQHKCTIQHNYAHQ